MKASYLIAAVMFALGLGVLIWGMASPAEVTLFGMTFSSRIAKGLGVIAMLLSFVTLLSELGHAQRP